MRLKNDSPLYTSKRPHKCEPLTDGSPGQRVNIYPTSLPPPPSNLSAHWGKHCGSALLAKQKALRACQTLQAVLRQQKAALINKHWLRACRALGEDATLRQAVATSAAGAPVGLENPLHVPNR